LYLGCDRILLKIQFRQHATFGKRRNKLMFGAEHILIYIKYNQFGKPFANGLHPLKLIIVQVQVLQKAEPGISLKPLQGVITEIEGVKISKLAQNLLGKILKRVVGNIQPHKPGTAGKTRQ